MNCYLAPELTRDAIFECLRTRRHYGTTGNRMLLDVQVTPPSGAERYDRDPALFAEASSAQQKTLLMGDIAKVSDDEVSLAIEAVGSAPIEKIDVFDGTELIHTYRPYGEADLGNRVRMTYSGAEYRGRSRTTTWDGDLTIAGNTIANAEMFNNWNLDRGIQSQTDNSLQWKAVTTGNYGGIDLWLDDRQSGKIKINTGPATIEADIADLGVEPTIYDAGGLARQLTMQRLPEQITETRAAFTVPVPVHASGDTRIFVRVQQIDGHRAWTTPVYLFR